MTSSKCLPLFVLSFSKWSVCKLLVDVISASPPKFESEKVMEIDALDDSGNTALHLACANGNLGTVMALVDYGGADVSADGDWGYSALHFYARQKQDKDEYEDPDKVDQLVDKLKKLAGTCTQCTERGGLSFAMF